jgi:hypothetical protein
MSEKGPFLFNGTPNTGSNITGNPANIPSGLPNYTNSSTSKSTESQGRNGPFVDIDFSNEVKSSSGTTANYRVVYHRNVKPFSPNRINDEKNQKHMVMFTMKSNMIKNSVRETNSVLEKHSNRGKHLFVMMNLPSLNHALYKLHAKEMAANTSNEDRKTVNDILKDIYCEGAVVTERGGESNGRPDVYGDRKINNSIRGRAEVFNHWGPVAIGQRLFFIVKRYRTTDSDHDSLVYNLNGNANEEHEKAVGVNPIQVVPYTAKNCIFPPLDALAYEDTDGHTKYGRVIYFGKVEKMTSNEYFGAFNKSRISRLMSDAGHIVNQGILTLLIQPELIG